MREGTPARPCGATPGVADGGDADDGGGGGGGGGVPILGCRRYRNQTTHRPCALAEEEEKQEEQDEQEEDEEDEENEDSREESNKEENKEQQQRDVNTATTLRQHCDYTATTLRLHCNGGGVYLRKDICVIVVWGWSMYSRYNSSNASL